MLKNFYALTVFQTTSDVQEKTLKNLLTFIEKAEIVHCFDNSLQVDNKTIKLKYFHINIS